MKGKRMFRLVIFDMDGLMYDTEAVTCRAFLEKGRELGYETTREQFVQILGMNSIDIQKKYVEYYGENVDAAALYHDVGARKEEILKKEGIPVKKGLFTLLDAIDKAGIKKAVASGSDKQAIQTCIESTGLDGRFDMLLSTKEVKRGKPFPDVFLEICRKFEIEPFETLVLEDSPHGVQAAVAGGIPVINIPDLLELPEDLSKKCLAVLKSLEEVIPFLEKAD